MNQNNRSLELSINRLAMMLEALEEYIRLTGHYSDWKDKEQFYNRTMPKGKNTIGNAEEHFFSQFYISVPWFKDEPESLRKETQKEFYKWIDHSGITAENCPEKLKNILNEINKALENSKSSLRKAYKEEKKKNDILKLKSSAFRQAVLEVNKDFGFVPQTKDEQRANWPKYYEIKITGNAEQGQKTFQQIKNSIVGNYDWKFTYSEKYYQKLKEKIKELEEKANQSQPKNQVSPKEEWKPGFIIDTFKDILRDLELYIQKLNYYPDWKISEWTGEGEDYLLKNLRNKSLEEIKNSILETDLKCLFLTLRGFKKKDLNYYPNLVSELKTEFSQWQSERKIDPNNCPDRLKQVLSEINEVLDNVWVWRKKKEKDQESNEDKQQQEIIKIVVELKSKIAELRRKYKIDLDSQFNNWERNLISAKSVSEAKSYQQQIEQKIQEEQTKRQPSTTTNENKIPLAVKIVLGVGTVILMLGIIAIVYRVIKNKKVKK